MSFLRGSGGKVTTVALATGVGAAEGASFLYYAFVPWMFAPGDRSLYVSIGFNVILNFLLTKFVEKFWLLRTWQDAVKLSSWLTLVYVAIYGPYVISWWNPMTYSYLIGPAGHTFVQLTAMTCSLWYFKNKK